MWCIEPWLWLYWEVPFTWRFIPFLINLAKCVWCLIGYENIVGGLSLNGILTN